MPTSRHVKVSLPDDLATVVIADARGRGRSVSSVIADAVAERYARRAQLPARLDDLTEVGIVNLRLSLAAFRSISAVVAMAPRVEEEARREEITARATEHRAAVLANLGLDEEDLLALTGEPAD